MPTPDEVDKFQYKDSIPRRYWDEKFVLETFQNDGVTSKKGGGAAGGTAGDENLDRDWETYLLHQVLA